MIDRTLPMRRAKRMASRRWRPKLDTKTVEWAMRNLSHEPDDKWNKIWEVRVWNKYCPDGDVDKLGQPDWEGSNDA